MAIRWMIYLATILMTGCPLPPFPEWDTGEEIECGYSVKEKVCDLTLMDQNGENWNLYDNLGFRIVTGKRR